MPKRHGAREQKKAAKQKAKREFRRKQIARASSPDPMVRLKSAADWPIVACLVPENLWEVGIGQLAFARRMPNGQVAFAAFLVDVFCLGVKNALWHIGARDDFDRLIDELGAHGPSQKVSPEYFSKLVHCAADYAQALGFAPHRDFRHARLLLAGIDPSQCAEEFKFGKSGAPLYIPGPFESSDKVRSIIARVEAAGGHFLAPAFDIGALLASDLLADDDDSDDDEGPYSDDEDNIIDV